jgi:general secretion pathway protein B
MSYILDALRKADAQRERQRAPGLHAQPLVTAPDERSDAAWRGAPIAWTAVGLGVLSIGLAAWQLSGPQAGRSAPAALATAPAAIHPAPPQPRPAAAPAPVQAAAPAAAPSPDPPAPVAAAPAPAPAPATAPVAEPSTTAPAGAPKLAVTGGVYSQSPGQRMLIVNGQVYGEGSEPAPGVLLERIRPNQAVLVWQGQRWLVRY